MKITALIFVALLLLLLNECRLIKLYVDKTKGKTPSKLTVLFIKTYKYINNSIQKLLNNELKYN